MSALSDNARGRRTPSREHVFGEQCPPLADKSACKARERARRQSDQKPGDVILANGKKFNIDEPKDLKPRQGLSSPPARKPRMPVPTQ